MINTLPRISKGKKSIFKLTLVFLTPFLHLHNGEGATNDTNTSNFKCDHQRCIILDKHNLTHANASEIITIDGDVNASFIVEGVTPYRISITPQGIIETKLEKNHTIANNKTAVNDSPLIENPVKVTIENFSIVPHQHIEDPDKKEEPKKTDVDELEFSEGPSRIIFRVFHKPDKIEIEFVDERLSILIFDDISEDDDIDKNPGIMANYFDILVAAPLSELPAETIEDVVENIDVETINKDIENIRGILLNSPSNSALAVTLNQMHPAKFADLGVINLSNHSLLYSNICQHFNELCCCSCENTEFDIWGKAFGNFQNRNTDGCSTGYNSNTNGLFIGMDYCPCNAWCTGVGFAYSYDDVKWKKDEADATNNSYYGFLYSSLHCQRCFLEAVLSLSYSCIEGNRYINDGTENLQRRASHDNNAWAYGGRLNGGFNFYLPCQITLQVYNAIDLGNVDSKAFTEGGATGLNLQVNRHSYLQLRNELGVLFSSNYFSHCNSICWTPAIGVSWVYKNPLSVSNITARLQNQLAPFVVNTRNDVTNQVSPEISLTIRSNCGVYLSAYYDGEFGSGWCNNEFSIHMGKNF